MKVIFKFALFGLAAAAMQACASAPSLPKLSVPNVQVSNPLKAKPIDETALWDAQSKDGATATTGFLPAADFLGAEFMQSELHSVDPLTWNDGYMNSYKITTDEHVFVVTGTENTKARIHEIAAVKALREKSTVDAIGNALGERGENLIDTPIRAFNGGRDRAENVGSLRDAGVVARTGIVDVIGGFAGGIKELGVTGLRITRGVGGTKCSGPFACAGKAGKDVWSGINSLTGKHEAARRAHAMVGTDPYSDNEALQHEVDRIAFAEAWTGTGFKFGVTSAGIPVLSPYTTGVGYYNNAEFLSQYEDADRRKNEEKAMLATWGVEEDVITALYRSEAYTPTVRTFLITAMSKIDNPAYRANYLADAVTAPTRLTAQSKLKIAQYFAALNAQGRIDGFVENTALALAISKDGAIIMPFVADYLGWTDEIRAPVADFAALAGPGRQVSRAEIHVLGRASPAFTSGAQALGVRTIEVSR